MKKDLSNEIFSLASDLVNFTDRHVFLTGKAGTGKTTFLKHIREHTHKNTAVVAPTGVAAINAGGTTLHSLLQLPFGAYVPDGSRFSHQSTREEIHDKQSLLARLRISGTKRKVIEALELLIIDEISMVRADLLDMVDQVLRAIRKRPGVPFGGVQILYIGDMFQLPPVVKEEDAEILKQYYTSFYFFDAKVIRECPPVYVELSHVYRQQDENFIRVLNQVRNNQLDTHGLEVLASRYLPGFEPAKSENYITLTTHNAKADQINDHELQAISKPVQVFSAEIKDEFPDHAFPAERQLRLKLGAQVMFLKNDTETPRRFFNGKIGVVTAIARDEIRVQCPEDEFPILVPQETWKNIRYTYEHNSKMVKEEELGSFTQYPLRLAWAITIHKSQGLTFEKAIIDAGRAFAPGQVYVALSRCTTLEGLVLLSPVHQGLVFTDERIAMFGRKDRPVEQLREVTEDAKNRYISDQIAGAFDFETLLKNSKTLGQIAFGFKDIFNAGLSEWVTSIEGFLQKLQDLSVQKNKELLNLLNKHTDYENHDALQQYLKETAPAFLHILQKDFWSQWRKMPGLQKGETRKSAATFLGLVEMMNDPLKEKILKLTKLSKGFEADAFFGKTANASDPVKEVIPSNYLPSFSVGQKTTFSAEIRSQGDIQEMEHYELYKRLRKLTTAITDRESLPSYRVANAETLREMATFLPQSLSDLILIKGFGIKKAEWIGDEFLEVIWEYCEEMGITGQMSSMPVPEKKTNLPKTSKDKTPTVQVTLEHWQKGLSVEAIAEERSLAKSTIEGHLAQAIETGELQIEDFMDKQKLNRLMKEFPEDPIGVSISPIKERLGDAVSFGELRMVLAHKRKMFLQEKPAQTSAK